MAGPAGRGWGSGSGVWRIGRDRTGASCMHYALKSTPVLCRPADNATKDLFFPSPRPKCWLPFFGAKCQGIGIDVSFVGWS